MRRFLLVSSLLVCSIFSFSQLRLGVLGGIANYDGDLVTGKYVGKLTKPAFGIFASHELTEKLSLRGGFTFAKVAGYDKYTKSDSLIARNLSFESNIFEGHVALEYSILNPYDNRLTPYVFGGLAVYHFNPYTYDADNAKVYLKPLSTEGQGLPQYPESRPYPLTQLALPFGGGIKYAISENVHVGLELGLRKLFTDYLDDVSTNYAAEMDLYTERGPQAADLAYRGDEVPGGNPNFPSKGAQRGSSQYKDWYYITGLRLSFSLGNGGSSGSGRTFGSMYRKGYGCPRNPM